MNLFGINVVVSPIMDTKAERCLKRSTTFPYTGYELDWRIVENNDVYIIAGGTMFVSPRHMAIIKNLAK